MKVEIRQEGTPSTGKLLYAEVYEWEDGSATSWLLNNETGQPIEGYFGFSCYAPTVNWPNAGQRHEIKKAFEAHEGIPAAN